MADKQTELQSAINILRKRRKELQVQGRQLRQEMVTLEREFRNIDEAITLLEKNDKSHKAPNEAVNPEKPLANVRSITEAVKFYLKRFPINWHKNSDISRGIAELGYHHTGKHPQSNVYSAIKRLVKQGLLDSKKKDGVLCFRLKKETTPEV